MVEYVLLALLALLLVGVIALWLRLGALAAAAARSAELLQRQDGVLSGLRQDLAQTRAELRDEQARLRSEQATAMTSLRTELAEQLKTLRAEATSAAHTTRDETLQLLGQQRTALLDTLGQFRTALLGTLGELRSGLLTSLEQARTEQVQRLADVTARLETMTSTTEQRLELLRGTVEGKLQEIRSDNATQLEQMRATVDEKLQSTLETRLGESLRSVGEQLERVHTGLGEMRTLATGVGDLKRVLSNVKTRGNWGEIQLGALLEQILTPEQYATNIAVRPGSNERVEFAIRLPGRGEDVEQHVWLPIDAKFPQEDYQRLIDAQEAADPAAADAASRALETRVRNCARDISTKYLEPPHTTEFGIMFLPTEGLYAEVARRPGLLDSLQREYRVMVAGPSNLAALLNSLQMGFRTLAIQKRTSEVWSILGRVKTEFGKFEGVLGKVQKKLQEANNTIEEAQRRTRVMGRQLKTVERSPDQSHALLDAELPLLEGSEVPQEPSRFQLTSGQEPSPD